MSGSRPARVLVVDDEAPARRKLARFLAEDPRFLLVSEADDGKVAVERIVSETPDLVFLDIQMPAFDGFEVLASVPRDRLPHVIFTTAFSEFAVRAFEVRAVDYLLKPFDQERFRSACDAYLERRRNPVDDWQMLESTRQSGLPIERLLVRHRQRLVVVRLDDVSRVSAEEKYVRLHTDMGSLLHRMPIGELAAASRRLAVRPHPAQRDRESPPRGVRGHPVPRRCPGTVARRNRTHGEPALSFVVAPTASALSFNSSGPLLRRRIPVPSRPQSPPPTRSRASQTKPQATCWLRSQMTSPTAVAR